MKRFEQLILDQVREKCDLNPVQLATIQRAFNDAEAYQNIRETINLSVYTSLRNSITSFRQIDERFAIVFFANETFAKYRTVDLLAKETFHKCSDTFDEQLLITLEYKYLGNNSQFTDFARKMLAMDEFNSNKES